MDDIVYLKEIFSRVHLTERQLDVLESRYFHKTSYREIGTEFGVTPERIRQIECKALRVIRDWIRLNQWRVRKTTLD